MPFLIRVKYFFIQNYKCAEILCLRDKKSKRIKKILDKNFETTDVDFNLTHLILDYKERQRAIILEKMRANFHERFYAHNKKK